MIGILNVPITLSLYVLSLCVIAIPKYENSLEQKIGKKKSEQNLEQKEKAPTGWTQGHLREKGRRLNLKVIHAMISTRDSKH